MFRYKWIHVDVGETAWNCVILRLERNVLKARWIQWTVFKAMRRTGTSQVFFKRGLGLGSSNDGMLGVSSSWINQSSEFLNEPAIYDFVKESVPLVRGKDCIIVSLVREATKRSNSVGFLADRRRMSHGIDNGRKNTGSWMFYDWCQGFHW